MQASSKRERHLRNNDRKGNEEREEIDQVWFRLNASRWGSRRGQQEGANCNEEATNFSTRGKAMGTNTDREDIFQQFFDNHIMKLQHLLTLESECSLSQSSFKLRTSISLARVSVLLFCA
jgi:hypothetical protein